MAVIVFPFTMELLVVALFSLVAIPVWVATRVFEAVADVRERTGTRRPRR